MDDYKCPICSNKSMLRTIPRKVGGQVAECGICGHLTLWPSLDHKTVMRQYAESAFVVKKNVGNALFDNQAFDLLAKHDSRSNLAVIDVGCGLGEFLKKCIKEKHRAVGIEVTPSIVEQLTREGLDVELKSMEKLSQTTKVFDWVACLDVMEHLLEPLAAIETLAKLVKKKGLLVVQTPNGDCIAKYKEKAYGLHVDKEHLNYFRADHLIRLFELHGLKLVCKKYCPSSRLTGRSKVPGGNSLTPRPTSEKIYRSNDQPGGHRVLVEKLPPGLRGAVRSMTQMVRRASAIDEIVSGTAHEFIIVLRRP